MPRRGAVLLALAVVLAGCGGGEDATPTTVAPPDTSGELVDLPSARRSTTTSIEEVGPSRARSLLEDLRAQQTTEGVEVNLPGDVLFDFGSAALRPDAASRLDAVVGAAKAYPTATIRLTGHTDDVGDEAANLRLSEQRAQAVAAALAARDASLAGRIQVVGRGEADPVAANRRPDGGDDPEGRQLNRRVAILFVGARL